MKDHQVLHNALLQMLGEICTVYLPGPGPAENRGCMTGQLQPSALQPAKGSPLGPMWQIRAGKRSTVRFCANEIKALNVKHNIIQLKP